MRRILCVLAAVAALAVTTPANALTCPMLTDDLADGRSVAVGAIQSDALDIVSADLASGATTVSVVLRVVALPDDPILWLGARWSVGWRIDGVAYSVTARRSAGRSAVYTGGFSHGPAALAVDAPAGTFTWTVDRADLPVLATPGKAFIDLYASTGPFAGNGDAASVMQTYVDQDPACITAA